MAAAINKVKTDSRFVSVFADDTPDVDITFMIPFLQRPTDHYLVGVDNLTISLSALGLLEDNLTEPDPKDIILQVIAKRKTNAEAPSTNRAKGEFVVQINDDLKFRTSRGTTILSLNEFMIQLDGFGSDVSAHIEKGLDEGAGNAEYIWAYAPGDNTVVATNQLISKHLGFYLTPDGRLAIVGSKYFWGNFIIWFPNKKYRRIIGIDTEFLSLTTVDGKTYGNRDVSALLSGGGADPDYILHNEVITRNDDDTLWSLTDGIAATDTINILSTWDQDQNHDNWRGQSHIWVAGNCLLSSLDRRISIELGASLPMLNSPMVDHNEETPDFVLGRWMFPRTAESVITGGSTVQGLSGVTQMVQKDHMGVITLQGAKDRVLYHTLRPQAKLQTVRLRLFARVRTYDEDSDRWKMRTMAVPTSSTDWWHARLHFVSKD